jgi:hypothetical protein
LYILTDISIDSAIPALMSSEELHKSIKELYLGNKGPKHPVLVTDLSVPLSEHYGLIPKRKLWNIQYL